MKKNLGKDIKDVTHRVDLLEQRDKSRPAPKRRVTEEPSVEWEDRRHEDSMSLPMPCWPPLNKEVEDDEDHCTAAIPSTTITLSENVRILTTVFRKLCL